MSTVYAGVDYGVPDRMEIEPESLLPGQFINTGQASPEKRLLVAVLSCALLDAMNNREGLRLVGVSGKPGQAAKRRPGGFGQNGSNEKGLVARRRKEAREWLLDDRMWTGSYVWVCELLGLEPSYVRRKAQERWS